MSVCLIGASEAKFVIDASAHQALGEFDGIGCDDGRRPGHVSSATGGAATGPVIETDVKVFDLDRNVPSKSGFDAGAGGPAIFRRAM